MGLLDGTTKKQYYEGGNYGNYQFTSLSDIINQFIVAYVGEGKIISKIKRVDVAFHAQRALQELSFDTFKSFKAKEITVPPTLQMLLPQDYINYTKISWIDFAGIKHLMYPTSKTSNPSEHLLQNSDGEFKLQATGDLVSGSSNITLDGTYEDISIGMGISGSYIPSGVTVSAISNSGGATIITMINSNSTAATPIYVDSTGANTNISNAGTILTFSKGQSLITKTKSSVIVENLSWAIGADDYKITSASAFSNVEVGMLVLHADFAPTTVVNNVSGSTIIVSNKASNTVAVTSGTVQFVSQELADSATWSGYKSNTPSENQDDYQDDTYWPMAGSRSGLDPQHAQANGSFYIDQVSGKIHFSSNISGKTVVLDYISDSLGDDTEMQVHKFAEEAMYKCIAYAVLSTSVYGQQLVPRFKKEKFAAVRQAKLRLSNIKLEEITQILRGKSKQIKH
tara:strand:- start:7433 stop:8794 length:1362 start_codon:yes stop_codon:yes gene_type:complete